MKLPHLVLVLCTVLPLSACNRTSNGPAPTRKPKVAFVTNNPEEFWTIAEAGCRKAEAELNVEVIFRRPQNPTAAAQKEILEDLMTQGAQAVSVSVIDPENQRGFLNQVAERIVLLTVDNDAPKSNRRCYLGTDNVAAGRSVGELVQQAMPKGGKIAIFVGQLDPINARERRQGVLEFLAGVESKGPRDNPDGQNYGKYFLVGTRTDNVDTRRAKDNAADVLAKFQNEPNLCLIGLWAYNPPAILSAVNDAQRAGKVKIVGFDEMENTLLGIKDGHIYGTVVQQPYEFGYQSVKMMADLIRDPKGTPVPADGIKHIPHLVLRKDNVEDFRTKLHQLLGKK